MSGTLTHDDRRELDALARELASRPPASARPHPSALDELHRLAGERARRTGETFARAFTATLDAERDLRRRHAAERLAERAPEPDTFDGAARRCAEALIKLGAYRLRQADPGLSAAQAHVRMIEAHPDLALASRR